MTKLLIQTICFVEKKQIVIDMYTRGIRELEAGIAIDLSHIPGEAGERARRLQEKMEVNLQMVRERRERLGLSSFLIQLYLLLFVISFKCMS